MRKPAWRRKKLHFRCLAPCLIRLRTEVRQGRLGQLLSRSAFHTCCRHSLGALAQRRHAVRAIARSENASLAGECGASRNLNCPRDACLRHAGTVPCGPCGLSAPSSALVSAGLGRMLGSSVEGGWNGPSRPRPRRIERGPRACARSARGQAGPVKPPLEGFPG
jgi:hypothetical protein